MPSKFVLVSFDGSPESLFVTFREKGHRRLYQLPWPTVTGRETLGELWNQGESFVSRLTELPSEARLLQRRGRRAAAPMGDFVIRRIVNVIDFSSAAARANPKQAPTLAGLQLHTLDGRGECFVRMPHAIVEERGLREGQIVCLPEFEPQGYC